MADDFACPSLPLRIQQFGACLAGTIQSVPGSGGRTSANSNAIRRTKPCASQNDPGPKSEKLELVISRNSSQRVRSSETARRPSKAKAQLAGLGQPVVNPRRIGRAARMLESESPLWKREMAKANCKTAGVRINNETSRSSPDKLK